LREPGDSDIVLDQKIIDRRRIRDELNMQNILPMATLTREIVGTLSQKQWGAYREAIKRKSQAKPETLDEMVEKAAAWS
jgi:hypothetical protein